MNALMKHASLGILSLSVLGGAAFAQTLDLDAADAVATTQEGAAQEVAPEAAQAAQAAQSTQAAANAAARRVASAPRQRAQRAVPGFVLRDIKFSGTSQYLSQQSLDAAEARLRGARLDARGVSAVGAILTQLYVDQGITTAQAVVRDVNVARGTITVELLEARIGQVNYNSNILSDAYLNYRLGIPQGALADNRIVDARLQQFQLTDGIAASAGYSAGANFGETDLTVSVPDIPRHVSTVTIDNYGSAASGEAQLTLRHTINSITGWNDPLSVGYTHREGSKALSLGYSRIVSRSGAQATLAVSGTESETLGALPVIGSQREASLGLSFPILNEADRRVSLGFSVAGYQERSDFLGFRILDQTGKEFTTSVSGFQRGDQWTLSGSFGLTMGQFDNKVTGVSDNGYSFASLSASYARNLLPDVFASVQIGAQKSLSGAMPSARQFTSTSASAVRGYPVSLSTGDEGYYARFQVEKSTAYEIAGPNFGLRPFTFFDVGEVRDSTGASLGQAQSVGLGASFVAGGSVFGDIYVAKPLETAIVGFTNPSTAAVFGGSISAKF